MSDSLITKSDCVEENNNNIEQIIDKLSETKINGCPFMNGSVATSSNNDASSSSSKNQDVFYSRYLDLEKILAAQHPISGNNGKFAHDEHLFIIIHQAYELWFKQIIFDLDSVMDLLSESVITDDNLWTVLSRLERINVVWGLLNQQVFVLDTMKPTSFLEFRSYLAPASGFQSLQFRCIENKLGFPENIRVTLNQKKYDAFFVDDKSKEQIKVSLERTLLRLIEKWLEKLADEKDCIDIEDASKQSKFKDQYEKAINKYLKESYLDVAQKETDESVKQQIMDEYKRQVETFASICDAEKHSTLVKRGERKLGYKALWGAIMIFINNNNPLFCLPFKIVNALVELDTLINRWRYNHATMAQRQVGSKMGTGGSSGYSYLRSTTSDRYKIFYDFINLSTWLLPHEYTPKFQFKE